MLPNKPPRQGLETNKPSLHPDQGDSEERSEPQDILFACFANPSADGLVDEVGVVVDEQLGDSERVVQIAAPDKVVRSDDRSASLPLGCRIGATSLLCDT